MSDKDPIQSEELERLIAVALDGKITDDQYRRLGELLKASRAARKQYVELVSMHALLRQTLSDSVIKTTTALTVLSGIAEEERKKPVLMPDVAGSTKNGATQRRSISWLGKAAMLALVAGVAALIYLVATRPSPTQTTTTQTVAAVTESQEAAWLDEQGLPVQVNENAALVPQTLRLGQGVAKVRFQSGTIVVLDARRSPAHFELRTANESVLHRGRATVVSRGESERGFAIGLPAATQGPSASRRRIVMNMNTQVGMFVTDDGQTQVHILRGTAELRPWEPSATNTSAMRLMSNGEALSLRSDSLLVEPISTTKTGFAPIERDATIDVRESQGVKAVEPAGNVTTPPALEASATVVARYLFKRDTNRDGTLTDSGPGGHHGAIGGATWTTGPRDGTEALNFNGRNHRVQVDIPGEFRSMSLTAWVRIEELRNSYNSLLLTEGFEFGEVHWQITRDRRLMFSVRYRKGDNDYRSAQLEQLAPGAWVHLATVYDQQSKKVIFYVNGSDAGSFDIRADDVLRLGKADIGNWAGRSDVNDLAPRNFMGLIGELGVYSGALTPAEVQRLHDETKP